MDTVSCAFSERLSDLLQLEGKTAYGLKKDTGLPLASIHKWLRGKYYPDLNAFFILADYFKISVDELLGLKETYGEKTEKKSPTKENAQKTLIAHLQNYLQTEKITKHKLATRLQVGQGTLTRWFAENAVPDTAVLIRISILLETPLDDLLGR